MSQSRVNRLGRCGTLIAVLTMCLVFAASPGLAQNSINVLEPGATVSGVLGPASNATTYVFDAGANTSATISLENISGGSLALLISDINGNTIAQAADTARAGSLAVGDIALSGGGRYNVFVYFSPGSGAPDTTFDIRLDLAQSSATDATGARSIGG